MSIESSKATRGDKDQIGTLPPLNKYKVGATKEQKCVTEERPGEHLEEVPKNPRSLNSSTSSSPKTTLTKETNKEFLLEKVAKNTKERRKRKELAIKKNPDYPPQKIKIRKKPKPPTEAVSEADRWNIVQEYTNGTLSVQEIADKFRTTADNVNLIVTRTWKTLTNVKEARALFGTGDFSGKGGSKDSQLSIKTIHNSKLINKEFLDLLSEDENLNTLSDAESIYAWIYVHSGNNDMAMEQSGLDIGLFRAKNEEDRNNLNYDKAIFLRGIFLRNRPNIASYIKDLRERRFVDQDISKSRIQSELIDQLEQMKESSEAKQRTNILRAIELLGKTMGAFVEKVEVMELNPSQALDHLIDMAKKATVKQLTEKSASETWEAVE